MNPAALVLAAVVATTPTPAVNDASIRSYDHVLNLAYGSYAFTTRFGAGAWWDFHLRYWWMDVDCTLRIRFYRNGDLVRTVRRVGVKNSGSASVNGRGAWRVTFRFGPRTPAHVCAMQIDVGSLIFT